MTEALLTGLLLGIALIFSVGPVIFTIIKLRINYGLASSFYFIAGVWLSDSILIVIANLFGGLLSELIEFRKEIGLAGGVLLIALGLYYLFLKKYHTKAELDNGVKIGNTTHLRLFITGFLINTLNPGVSALWFAAATNTIQYVFEQKLMAFGVCMGIIILSDFLKIHLAGKLRAKLNDKNIKLLNRTAGVLYVIFGVALIIGAFLYKPDADAKTISATTIYKPFPEK